MCNLHCTNGLPHLISDATVPCEIEHSLHSYKMPHQN